LYLRTTILLRVAVEVTAGDGFPDTAIFGVFVVLGAGAGFCVGVAFRVGVAFGVDVAFGVGVAFGAGEAFGKDIG
jgi:hypothetical protein